MIQTMTPAELKEHLKQNTVLLIDVREPSEHAQESIAGSLLIPLGQLSCKKLPSKKKIVVVHCRFGKRSAEACKKLQEEDPSLEVYSLEGGITAWIKAGYPVLSG